MKFIYNIIHNAKLSDLDRLGEKGWEVCGVVEKEGVITFYLKKRVPKI